MTTATDAAHDPIDGVTVGDGPPGPGKLADLDPEQQMVSQIFGHSAEYSVWVPV